MTTNPWTVLAIVAGLITELIIGTIAIAVLEYHEHPAPSSLVAITTSCVVALTSFLTVLAANGHGRKMEDKSGH